MKHIWICSLLILSLSGCCKMGSIESAARDLADQLAPQIPASDEMPRIAVVGMSNIDGQEDSELSDALSENLTTELSLLSQGRFILIDRKHIKDAITELEFQLTDLIDRQKASRLGNFLGAQALVTGTVERSFWGTYRINLRIIHVETLTIWGSARAYMNPYQCWALGIGILIALFVIIRWMRNRRLIEKY